MKRPHEPIDGAPKSLSRREWLKLVALAAGAPLIPGTLSSAAESESAALPPSKPSSLHRILTCNILLDLPEQHGTPEDWALYRRTACMQVISSRNPHIVCMQEVGRGQNDDFVQAFPQFTAFGYADPYVDRYPRRFQSAKNVILYSRERYEQTGAGIYWLSPTPLVAGSRLRPTKLPRHVTWLRLKDRQTGREFRVMNTHLALEQPVRIEEAKMMADEAAQYADYFPQILAGDMNSANTSLEHMVLTDACWEDTFEAVHRSATDAAKGDGSREPAPAAESDAPQEKPRIDFIMYRGNVKPLAAEIIRDRPGGHAPSDHYFVSADVDI